MGPVLGWLLVLAGAAAAGELRKPLVGYFADEAGQLRSVVGVGGSFIVEESALAGVRAVASAGDFALIETGDELLLVDAALAVLGRAPLPAAASHLGVAPDGRFGVAYLPGAGQLCRLEPGREPRLSCVTVAAGAVRAIGAGEGHTVSLAIERDGQLWHAEVDAATGSTLSQVLLSGVTAPVLLLPGGGVVFSRGAEIILRNPEGAEASITGPAPVLGLEAMGENWVRLRAAGGLWALRVVDARLELHRLPGEVR